MATLFERAVSLDGQAYLDAERQLLAAGDAARQHLGGVLTQPVEPLVRVVAVCLLAWLGSEGARYAQALQDIDGLQARLARTPIGTPGPTHLAGMLNSRYQGHLVDLLALRLLKLPDWPQWKRLGALMYLKQHARPASTEVLALLAARTADEAERQLAVDAVLQAGDPQLKPKLQALQARLAAQGGQLPPALAERLQRD